MAGAVGMAVAAAEGLAQANEGGGEAAGAAGEAAGAVDEPPSPVSASSASALWLFVHFLRAALLVFTCRGVLLSEQS